jgi:hypothetical protein
MRFNTHVVDRSKKVLTDSRRRNLCCYQLNIAPRSIVDTLCTMGRINDMCSVNLANWCKSARRSFGIGTRVALKLKTVACHWGTNYMNESSN